MNYANLRRLLNMQKESCPVVVFDYEGRRLFCDGHIICLASELDLVTHENGSFATAKMVERGGPMFIGQSDESYVPLETGGVYRESEDQPIVRKFGGIILQSVIQEKFWKCFNPDAQLLCKGSRQPVLVYEAGVLSGIVCTYESEGISGAEPVDLETEAVYHVCARYW